KAPALPLCAQTMATPPCATLFPLASVSCAVRLTAVPATGVALVGLTKNFAAAPGTGLMVAVVPLSVPSFALTVCGAIALSVLNVIVAKPLAFVVDDGPEGN